TKKQQMRIQDVLSGAKIDFEVIDVSASKDDLAKMREIVGNSKALAPQIANGDTYCG
ncbi:SH3 domain-binding glutamic acid-rich-like protein 3, partial [Biomphalaria glabrata]